MTILPIIASIVRVLHRPIHVMGNGADLTLAAIHHLPYSTAVLSGHRALGAKCRGT
jgi:hypothetical protein